MIISAFAEMDEDEDGEITQEEFIKVKVGTHTAMLVPSLSTEGFCFYKSSPINYPIINQ